MKVDDVKQTRGGREALRIIDRLQTCGFTAVLAGGCVRDTLMNRTPKDYDVATDATPTTVREIFGRRHTLAFGESFGVIGVLPPPGDRDDPDATGDDPDAAGDDPDAAGDDPDAASTARVPTEVATFRSDGNYGDGRRPDSVSFGNAADDARRRDFTVNGLFFDPASNQVIDYVGGQSDLDAGVLRTIGDPAKRFAEDRLRLLRAVRFAVTKNLSVEPSTLEAIVHAAPNITTVSGERIGQEMRRCLRGEHAASTLSWLDRTGLNEFVFPGVGEAIADRVRPLARPEHVFTDSLAITLLMIDKESPVQRLEKISRAWRLSNVESRRVRFALEHHHVFCRPDHPWSVVQPRLVDPDAAAALAVAAALADDSAVVDRWRERLAWTADRLDPPPLVTGEDLKRLGIPPGPAYRRILQTVRDEQLDGELTDRDSALNRAHDLGRG